MKISKILQYFFVKVYQITSKHLFSVKNASIFFYTNGGEIEKLII